MRSRPTLVFCIALLTLASSCGVYKRKKFLDYFTTYKLDTLSIFAADYSAIYDNPNAPMNLKGQVIDSVYYPIFELEAAEDLMNFMTDEVEKGPTGYYKIKLDLGFYFLIVRSGGEYWNSRFYGCLYNSGDKHVTQTVVLADLLGDAGYSYSCNSFLKKQNKQWNIYVDEEYMEPLDVDWESLDTFQVTKVNMTTVVEPGDGHFYFNQTDRKENTATKVY